MLEEEERAVTFRAFSAYGIPLDTITSFRYLGRVISVADNNWTAVDRNFSKERDMWRKMASILSREGEEPWVSGFFFKAVVQAVLIFGAETWVVTPRMGRFLWEFQEQMARRLTGR